jgi:uncharacterized protein (DUF1778 family)
MILSNILRLGPDFNALQARLLFPMFANERWRAIHRTMRSRRRTWRGKRIDVVDTGEYFSPMPKGRSSSSQSPGAATVAVKERSSAADTKGSINLRIETRTRQMIDDAAAVLGKTRTDFMIDSARALAIDVLLDQRLFVLDAERYDAFIHALDNPPAPGPKLRALLRRKPAWET